MNVNECFSHIILYCASAASKVNNMAAFAIRGLCFQAMFLNTYTDENLLMHLYRYLDNIEHSQAVSNTSMSLSVDENDDLLFAVVC